jgi:hypothetical protein
MKDSRKMKRINGEFCNRRQEEPILFCMPMACAASTWHNAGTIQLGLLDL